MKWALIGASDIASTRVVPAIRSLGQEVYGVMSSDQSRGLNYASANDIEHTTTDLDELLKWPIDAVYISTTNELHARQSIAAARAQKHILCEKPLATDLADARDMLAEATANNVVLATNHHIRVSGVHQAIREIVKKGDLGEVIVVRINHAVALPERLQGWRLSGADQGAGVVLDIVVHDVDTLRADLGSEIVEVMAFATNSGLAQNGIADSSSCLFRFDNGSVATTIESFVVPFNQTSMEIHGTKGSLVATGAMGQDPTGEIFLTTSLGRREILVSDRENMYVKTIRQFELACRGMAEPFATGEDGLASLRVAAAVLTSSVKKRAVAISEFDE